MKIAIITQDAPIYLPQFLDKFIDLVKKKHTIDSIVVLSPLFKKTLFSEIKERYNYYGPVDFLKMFFYILKNKISFYSVNSVIAKHKLNKGQTKNINSEKFINYIKKNQIDLIVSAAASRIFKKELLSASKKGCINYHTSLLPKYRGRQPLFWAMLNNEKEAGMTVHEMNENLDDGPIIIQKKVNIDTKETLHSLYLKTIKISPNLLAKAIDKIENNNNKRIKNNKQEASYYSFPTKKDAQLFRKKGKNFF